MASKKRVEDVSKTVNKPTEAGQSEVITSSLKDKQLATPPAWKPGVIWDNELGEITSRPTDEPKPHWDDILASWGYDPEKFEIIEPVRVSTWDAQGPDGMVQMWSYKAGIRLRSDDIKLIPYDELVKEIKTRKKKKVNPGNDSTFIVCLADTQFGKGDGDGFAGTIERFLTYVDGVTERIINLEKIGRKGRTLLVAGLGDIIEGCSGNYTSQPFTVEANRREQIRIARRLFRDAIAEWSEYFEEVIVTAVPGNHGENRDGFKAYTTPGDNDDVAIFEILAEIFAYNPEAYGHIKFHIPGDEVYVTFDLHGTIVGFTHGHITKGGGNPQAKIKSWWEDQTFGEQPMGSASVLITGHYHHFSAIEYGKKSHLQCPAADGGSDWWRNLAGADSRPGILTLIVDQHGYNDIQLIGGIRP